MNINNLCGHVEFFRDTDNKPWIAPKLYSQKLHTKQDTENSPSPLREAAGFTSVAQLSSLGPNKLSSPCRKESREERTSVDVTKPGDSPRFQIRPVLTSEPGDLPLVCKPLGISYIPPTSPLCHPFLRCRG